MSNSATISARSQPARIMPGVGLVPQGQAQGVDEDGLAGPGLAGQGGQPGLEVQFQGADDGQVADEDVGQHESVAGVAWCGQAGRGCDWGSVRAGRWPPQPSLARRIA